MPLNIEELIYRTGGDRPSRAIPATIPEAARDNINYSNPPEDPQLGLTYLARTGGTNIQNLEAFGFNEARSGILSSRDATNAIRQAANTEGVEKEALRQRGLASAAQDTAEGTFERQTRSFDLSDRQKRAAQRKLGLNRAIVEDNASSGVRRGFADRAEVARQAGVGLEDIAFSQQARGLSALANAEGQANVRDAQDKAQKEADRNSLYGSIAGAFISLLAGSSEEIKDKVDTKIERASILEKLRNVRVDKWKYKGKDNNHIGPYAEEFNDTFGVNQEDRGLVNLIDVMGVTMGAVKELDAKLEALKNA